MKDRSVKYYIHYAGWSKNWDEWVSALISWEASDVVGLMCVNIFTGFREQSSEVQRCERSTSKRNTKESGKLSKKFEEKCQSWKEIVSPIAQ